MAWLFSRGRGKHTDQVAANTEPAPPANAPPPGKTFNPNNPRNATPRSPPQSSSSSSMRKRRRSAGDPSVEAADAMPPPLSRGRSHRTMPKASIENMTALPGAQRLERSPHLRRSNTYRTAIPYKSARNVPASRLAAMTEKSMQDIARHSSVSNQQKRLSKSHSQKTRAVREEEIRAMSASENIPRNRSSRGDIQTREVKKARQGFGTRTSDDNRASIVSLPFPASIHSSMSGNSEQRSWEIPKLNFFSPRPTIRLAHPRTASSTSNAVGGNVSRNVSKRGKMPAVAEEGKKRDRQRVDGLADNLDAADLRAALDRDRRRRDKEVEANQAKLDAKLRRRAEKMRSKERQQQRDTAPVPPQVPTDVHPAFRQQPPFAQASSYGQAPLSPVSITDRTESPTNDPTAPYPVDPTKDQYVPGPYREDTPQSFDRPPRTAPFASPMSQKDDQSFFGTPLGTPMEDPVVDTAREIRYAPGRASQYSNLSPPQSPARAGFLRSESPLRRQVGKMELANTREAAPSDRRSGAWTSIFKRNKAAASPTRSQGASSFSNTSRDSLSRQPLPAHLVGQSTAPRRLSNVPARTHSIFREDLPESSTAPSGSRMNSVAEMGSPEMLAAAFHASARRNKHGGSASANAQADPSVDPQGERLTSSDDSPHTSMPMSESLASIDAEGAWLTGRPSRRVSHQSQPRTSIGSDTRRVYASGTENPSFDRLDAPDDQLVRRLTPSPEDADESASANPALFGMPVRRTTTRRRPTITQIEAARSREALVACGDDSPIEPPSHQAGTYGSLESIPTSIQASDSDASGEIADRFAPQAEQSGVVYGRGHARHLSSGSAKLLDIPPSRSKSGRVTPASGERLSVAGIDGGEPESKEGRTASVVSAPFKS